MRKDDQTLKAIQTLLEKLVGDFEKLSTDVREL